MSKTLSLNCGSAHNEKHNRRDFDKDVPKHIDANAYDKDVVIVDNSLEETFNEFFKDETAAYNARQKPCRQIHNAYEHYYDEQLRARDKDAAEGNHTHKHEKKAKAPVKELVIQIGSHEDGITYEDAVAILSEYARQFETLNPAFKVCQAIIHADEPDGSVHMHLNFCYKDTREADLMKAFKFEGALNSMGYESGYNDTKDKIHSKAFDSWQRAQRDVIRDIAKTRGIDIEEPQKSTRRHYDTPEYKVYADAVDDKAAEFEEISQDVNKAKDEQTALVAENAELTQQNDKLKGEILNAQRLESSLNTTRGFLARIVKLISPDKVVIPVKDFKDLETTARHGVEVDETFNQRSEELDARERAVSKEEARVRDDVDKIYADEEARKLEELSHLQSDCQALSEEASRLRSTDELIKRAKLEADRDKAINQSKEDRKELRGFMNKIKDLVDCIEDGWMQGELSAVVEAAANYLDQGKGKSKSKDKGVEM